MIVSTFREITKPYSIVEAWGYDRLVGPALSGLFDEFSEELCDALPNGARVIDVGCGGGQIALKLAAQRPDLDIVGVDLSAEQIGRARGRATVARANVQFVVGDALNLPVPDRSFDLVLSVGSIKHWPDRKLGLAECARVLKNEGQFFITEIDRGCELAGLQKMVDLMPIPAALRPVALMFVRTYVAGQSIDVVDASRLMEAAQLLDGQATRLHNGGLLMQGRRSSAD